MSLSFHRYTLKSRAALNSRSDRVEHEGALIRVGEGDIGQAYGYGCIHPWPELGDLDLDSTLQCLKNGESTPLIRQALYCARQDAVARGAGVSSFVGYTVPESHATVALDEKSFIDARQAGFETVKVKVGRDLDTESQRIRLLAEKFPEFQWRLDFNHTRSVSEVEGFLRSLGKGVCRKIDFMEDAWLGGDEPAADIRGVPLAVDRELENPVGKFPVSIAKPARDSLDTILERAQAQGAKIVFTSYMDHPLGQSYAALQAAVANFAYPMMVDRCGLVTHGLFEPDAFSEALGTVGPEFKPAAGTGLGFDDLLEKLSWTPLS